MNDEDLRRGIEVAVLFERSKLVLDSLPAGSLARAKAADVFNAVVELRFQLRADWKASGGREGYGPVGLLAKRVGHSASLGMDRLIPAAIGHVERTRDEWWNREAELHNSMLADDGWDEVPLLPASNGPSA